MAESRRYGLDTRHGVVTVVADERFEGKRHGQMVFRREGRVVGEFSGVRSWWEYDGEPAGGSGVTEKGQEVGR